MFVKDYPQDARYEKCTRCGEEIHEDNRDCETHCEACSNDWLKDEITAYEIHKFINAKRAEFLNWWFTSFCDEEKAKILDSAYKQWCLYNSENAIEADKKEFCFNDMDKLYEFILDI